MWQCNDYDIGLGLAVIGVAILIHVTTYGQVV